MVKPTDEFCRESDMHHFLDITDPLTRETMEKEWDDAVRDNNYEVLVFMAANDTVFPESRIRRLVCRLIRTLKAPDGRTVWDMLDREAARNAVNMAEMYAAGMLNKEDLVESHIQADFASDVLRRSLGLAGGPRPKDRTYSSANALDAAASVSDPLFECFHRENAFDCLVTAVCCAAKECLNRDNTIHVPLGDAVANDARDAICRAIAELGNPFKKGEANENC